MSNVTLANSNGANKGKRYTKLTGEEVLTTEREEAVKILLDWYNENTDKLQKELIGKGVFDPDVFNDTFVKLYEAVAFKRTNIANLKAYFSRAYCTNKFRADIQAGKFDETHFRLGYTREDIRVREDYPLIAASMKEAEETEANGDIRQLCAEVFDYVEANYSEKEAFLFREYIQAKPIMSYKELSKKTKVPYYIIAASLSTILKDVREVFEQRKSEVIG